MSAKSYELILTVIALAGGFFVLWAVMRLLAPPEQKEGIADLQAQQIKSVSSFARLRPEENLLDRFALWTLETFKLQKGLEEMCLLLGSPPKPQPVDLLFKKIYFGVFGTLILMLAFRSVFPIFMMPVMFMLPDMMTKSAVQKRQQDMLGNFSTTVDLAALIIESGLDYMTAFERIVKIARKKTLLEREIEQTLNETKLGYSRREALERMAARTGVQDIRSFVGLIVQSDELGTSLVDLLRNFSVDLRFRRLNKAEKLAAQASTKMLIPLFIFIFPVVFIMILAPMIADFSSSGSMF
jgi:tight adherence protein C